MLEEIEKSIVGGGEQTKRDYNLGDLVYKSFEEEIAAYPPADQPIIKQYFEEEKKEVIKRLFFPHQQAGSDKMDQKEFEKLQKQLDSFLEYALAKAEERQRAEIDYLTGFFSSKMASAHYELERERLNKNPEAGKVLVWLRLDLDFFKDINDRLGHNEGDRVLKELGKAAKKHLRATDAAFRMGGDEFAFILPDVKKENVLRIIPEKIKMIQEDVKTSEGKTVSFSAGLKMIERGAKDFFEEIDEQADGAARLAKINGRARLEVYNEKTEEKLAGKEKHPLYLEMELRRALSRLTGHLDPRNENDQKLNAAILKLAELLAKKK